MNDEIIESIKGTTIILSSDDGKHKQFDIAGIFSISEDSLSKEYAMQASLYAYFAVLAAKAERNMSISKLAVEREYAVADQAIREQLARDDIKSTEPMVKQLIAADEEYCTIQDTATAAEYEYNLLKAISKALEMRSNMLISMGALMRHEMDMSGMNMKQREYDSAVDETKERLRKIRSQRG